MGEKVGRIDNKDERDRDTLEKEKSTLKRKNEKYFEKADMTKVITILE
jgi:hypothetical protein